MRKLLLILAFPTLAFAGGPKSTFPQPRGLDAEFVNTYHDIANPVINIGSASTMTITQLNVSSIAVTGQIDMGNKKIINQANGSASSDSAAFGQLCLVKFTNFNTASVTSTTSASFASSALTAAIIPSSASDVITIIASGEMSIGSATIDRRGFITLFNGASNLGDTNAGLGGLVVQTAGRTSISPLTISYTDAPATTSSVTYTIKIRSENTSDTTSFPVQSPASMMLLDFRPC